MVRKLPWSRNERQQGQERPLSVARKPSSSMLPMSSSSTPQSRTLESPVPNGARADRSSLLQKRRCRSPSTSPAPAPPTENFLIPGMDHDDRFRMVEDELLAIAQTFTAHLHAAEYQRLKAAAESRSAVAMQTISQPERTVSLQAALSKRRRKEQEHQRERLLPASAAAKKSEKSEKSLLRATKRGWQDRQDRQPVGEKDDESTEDEDEASRPWRGTSLQNLMDGGPPRRAKLVPMLPVSLQKSTATAETVGAGQRKISGSLPGHVDENDGEEEDDDLDGPPMARTQSTASAASERPSIQLNTQQMQQELQARPATKPSTGQQETNGSSDNDLDAGDLMLMIRLRREREKAERKQQRKDRNAATESTTPKLPTRREARQHHDDNSKDLDIVPSFL